MTDPSPSLAPEFAIPFALIITAIWAITVIRQHHLAWKKEQDEL